MTLPKLFTQKPQLTKALGAAVIVGLIFAAGIITGMRYDDNRHSLDLSKFWRVYDLIQSDYVDKPDDAELIDGAVRGLVEGLGDPFSAYLSTEEKRDLNEELSGQFEGIGAELTEKNGITTIVSPLSGSPAEKAGLKANDIIAKVNNEDTDGLAVGEVVNKIRGPKGTEVTLTIFRDNLAPFDVKIIRETIIVKSVTSKMIGSVGYLEINQFGESTVADVAATVKGFRDSQPKAIIIDLRNNPGGFLNSVPPIAGHFIPPSVVVKEKYRDGRTDQLRSNNIPEFPNTPLYVLINSGSASASEILAGALQDYKRATLIGETSFGKGSVQELINLPGNSALRVTIAEWLTPLDRAINKIGIEPDVKVADEKTDGKDPVLEKALELANK